MRKAPPKAEYAGREAAFSFLVSALADHLRGRATAPVTDLDWEVFCRLVRAHQLAAVVYRQCGSFLPAAARAQLEKEYGATLFVYANRVSDLREISAAFQAANLPLFSVKGLAVARYYPIPNLRSMGDCDLLIRPGDEEAAIAVMRSLGFRHDGEVSRHAWTCERGGRHYELHSRLAEEDEYPDPRQSAFFNGYMSFTREGELDWNFHFLFLLSHLRKHFLANGVGVRQFFDLAALIGRGPGLDWARIGEMTAGLGLTGFAHACYSLIESWFGVTAPVEFRRLSPAETAAVTDKITDNGVFGFADAQNKFNDARRSFLSAGRPRWLLRLSMLARRAFPSYSTMRTYPGCGYLDGRPWLLPAAWAHRFFLILFRRDKKIHGETLHSIFISGRDLDRQKKLLQIMDLQGDFDKS